MAPGLASDSDIESVLSLELPRVEKLRRNSAGPKYTCSYENCQESFKRLDHLDRHEFKHTGIRKHSCHYENCEKSYTILTHLKRHVRNTHERKSTEPIKTIPCELDTCDKLFTSLCNMHRHMREVHENPKIYQCQHCSAKFKQKMKMRRHEIAQHSGSYPYNCDKCQKGFHQERYWQKHTVNCKIYPCPTCNIEFNKWSVYIKHCKDTKHGQQCFQCEYCPRVYVRSTDLKGHVAAKHLNKDDNQMPVSEFKCNFENCERSYAYEKNLKQHILIAHMGQRFKCSQNGCEKTFSSTQNVQKHITREHINPDETNMKEKVKKESRKERKRRKDAGISKVSNLTKLSGLIVDKKTDESLRHREAETMDMVIEALMEETLTETSDKTDL